MPKMRTFPSVWSSDDPALPRWNTKTRWLKLNPEELDNEICDTARDLAFSHKQNIETMWQDLQWWGVTLLSVLSDVVDAQQSPKYNEDYMYRGKLVDKKVVEAVKACLWLTIKGFALVLELHTRRHPNGTTVA